MDATNSGGEDVLVKNPPRIFSKSYDWGASLTSELLQEIARCAGPHSWGNLRCVCQNWRRGVSLAIRTVRLTVPDRSAAPAPGQQPADNPPGDAQQQQQQQQRPTRKATAGGRAVGRGGATAAAAPPAATAVNHAQEQQRRPPQVADVRAAAGEGYGQLRTVPPFALNARPEARRTSQRGATQRLHQDGQREQNPLPLQHQQPTVTGRGIGASSGRAPPRLEPYTSTPLIAANAKGSAAAAAAAGTLPTPGAAPEMAPAGGDASCGRVAAVQRPPLSSCYFEPRPELDSLACVFNLHRQSTVAAVAAATAAAAAAAAATRIPGEASDSQAAGVASSVGSSSIVVWSFLEAADKLASAFPSYDNLSLNFAEPLPLAAAGGGGEVGGGRWLQAEMSAALQQLLSSRLVSLSLSGHTPYPLFMASPPPLLPPALPPPLPQHQHRLQRTSKRASSADAAMEEMGADETAASKAAAAATTIVAEGPVSIGGGNGFRTSGSRDMGSEAAEIRGEEAIIHLNRDEPHDQRRQRKLQPPLQQQLQRGDSSAGQHVVPEVAAAAAAAAGPRRGLRIPFTSSPDEDDCGNGDDEEMFTVADALKAFEDEATITALNGPSRGAASPGPYSVGVGAGGGAPHSRSRRQWLTVPGDLPLVVAAAVPYQVGADSSLTQTERMARPAQRHPQRGVTAAEAGAAASERCVVPVGSCSPAVAVVAAEAAAMANRHARCSSCSASLHGSLGVHRHVEEAAGGFRSGSGESDPDRDGFQRRHHHHIYSLDVVMAVERGLPLGTEANDYGDTPGSRCLVPERGGSGVSNTPGTADGCCYCLGGSEGENGSGCGRDPPLSAVDGNGDGFGGGGRGGMESMDLDIGEEGAVRGLKMTDGSAGDSEPRRVSTGDPGDENGGGRGRGGDGGALVQVGCSTGPLSTAGLRTAVEVTRRGADYHTQPTATDTAAATAATVTAATVAAAAETAEMIDVSIRKKNSHGDDGSAGGMTNGDCSGGRGSGNGGGGSSDGGNGDGSHSRHADGSGCTEHAMTTVHAVDSDGNAVHIIHSSSGAHVGKAAADTAVATAATPAAAAVGDGAGQLTSVGASGGCVASANFRRIQPPCLGAGVSATGDARACGGAAMIAPGATAAGPVAAATATAAAVGGGALTASAEWHRPCAGCAGGTGAGVMRLLPALTIPGCGGSAGAGAGTVRTPPLLSRLSQLVSLTLAADLGFPSPQHLEAITALRGLQCLDMRGAKFMQVDGDASLASRQAWLHVSNEHVAVVARCTGLTSLSLNHLHPVSGNQLAALTALNRLTFLALTDALSGNTVHGAHIKVLAEGLPELRSLDISRVTCPPLHLPPQQQQPQQPSAVQGLVAAAATTAAAAAAKGPSGGGGGAAAVRQIQPPQAPPALPPPPPLPLLQHLPGCGDAIKTRASSPFTATNLSHWQPWGPVLGLFHGLTSLHLQVACTFETELLSGVAALPLLDNFSMELLDVPPPQLASMLEVLAAACTTAAGGGGSGDGSGSDSDRRRRRHGAIPPAVRPAAAAIASGGSGGLSRVLHALTLTACMLYDEHLELIGRLGQLRCIRMDQVDIRTRDPDGWTALSGAHTLEIFSFRAWNNPVLSASNLCVLTNDSLAMMAANWPRLQHFTYNGKVALTEKAEEHLSHMSCLASLEISGTDGTAFRIWRSAATGQLLRTVTLPYTAAAKVSSRNGYVTYSDSDDSAKSEGSEASVNWMGETGYVTSEYDAD